jgi:hypothetical protein
MCTPLIGAGLTGTNFLSYMANTLAYFAGASVTRKKKFYNIDDCMSNNEAH